MTWLWIGVVCGCAPARSWRPNRLNVGCTLILFNLNNLVIHRPLIGRVAIPPVCSGGMTVITYAPRGLRKRHLRPTPPRSSPLALRQGLQLVAVCETCACEDASHALRSQSRKTEPGPRFPTMPIDGLKSGLGAVCPTARELYAFEGPCA